MKKGFKLNLQVSDWLKVRYGKEKEGMKGRERFSYKWHLIIVNRLNAANWFVELWASFSRNKYEHYLYFYFHFQQTKNGNFKKEISSYLFNNVQKVTWRHALM